MIILQHPKSWLVGDSCDDEVVDSGKVHSIQKNVTCLGGLSKRCWERSTDVTSNKLYRLLIVIQNSPQPNSQVMGIRAGEPRARPMWFQLKSER